MNIGDFISHIKHNSLSIKIFKLGDKQTEKLLFSGTVGEYKTSVAKQTLDKKEICFILPKDCELVFHVEVF